MTLNWNIDTEGTHAVLTTAASNIDAQNEAAKAVGTAISDVGAVLGTGLVAQALNEFVEHSLALKVKFIAGRSAAIVQGTNDALMAYVQADSVMAQQAQASAIAAGNSASGNSPSDGGAMPLRAGHRPAELG